MTTASPLPIWFKIACYAALLWTLLGVASYLMDVTMSEEALANLPAAEQELYSRRPAWVVALYAVAVFGALLGAIGLLMRRKWSTPLFALSLGAVLVQFVFVLFVLGAIALLGWTAAIFPVVIVIFGAAMLQMARIAGTRGWLS